ncbi:MAG: catalase [Methylophaga sp.]|nr:MAG: catalase [Methylophaga sp.]
MKIIKKLLSIVVILLILLVGFIFYHAQDNAIVTTEEIIPDDEAEQTQRAVDNFIDVITFFQTDKAHRGAHAKGHACVKAYFDINDNINPDLQQGIFKQADTSYKTWIRFSNGTPKIANDAEKDSRGIAIKLLNVVEQGQTQEFLLHNSPAFFSTNLDDYNDLVESEDKLQYFLKGYNPFNWRLRELSNVLNTLSPPPYSPIWEEYFSNTAYKLGPHNVKYKVQSCQPFNQISEQDQTDPDFLQKTLATELENGGACLQFMVQLQDANKHMPIEDPSVLWKESDSPYIAIATITIPQQQFDTAEQQQFCENLSFSPWNALAEHKPIGALNRVRKMVYQASSLYRHQFNKTDVPQSLDW